MSPNLISSNSTSGNKNWFIHTGALRFLVFVFTSTLAIVSFSSNVDPLFADLFEEREEYTNGKIYYIGANNSDPLSTILSSQNAQDYTNRGPELALAIDPNDTDALYNKGVELLYAARQDEAITYFDKILSIKPDNFDALYNKGVALDSLRKYDEAIVYYDKALEVNPNDFYVLYYKGTALYNLNKYDEAITSFDKALEVNPNDIDILNGKGKSLSSLGNYDEAIASFDKVLEVDPDNAYAREQKQIASTTMDNTDPTITYVQASPSDLDEQISSANDNTLNNTLNTFSDSKTKVNFQYPSNWEIASDEYLDSVYEEGSEKPTVLLFPKSLSGSSFFIQYQELPISMSANEFVKAAKKDLEKNSSEDISMSKYAPISAGSLDGYKYNITQSDETYPDGVFVQTQAIFIKNSKLFMIAYNLGEADVEKDLQDIESMIDSFAIGKVTKDETNGKQAEENETVTIAANALANDKEMENAKDKGKAILINILSKVFPQTTEKFSNSNYGVEIAFPNNWTGFEMKIAFPMAVVSPEGFNITGIFSPFVDSAVDNIAESIISANGTELSEQEFRNLLQSKVEQSGEALSKDLMEYAANRTSTMGVFIYDKEFARLMNSIDPNTTESTDSLTSLYELLVSSDPAVSCERQSLNQTTLGNNISAEVSTEQCSYSDSELIDNNLNYFILTPDAIVGIQYTSDKNNENDKYLPEFEEALKTLSVEESIPINNQTIQQFLNG